MKPSQLLRDLRQPLEVKIRHLGTSDMKYRVRKSTQF